MIRTVVRFGVLLALLLGTALLPSVGLAQSSSPEAAPPNDMGEVVQEDAPMGEQPAIESPAVEMQPAQEAAPAVQPAVLEVPTASPVVITPPTPFVKATLVSTKKTSPSLRLFPDPSGAWPVSGLTSAAVKAINVIASPVDAPLFTSMFHPGATLFELRLAKADEAIYSYACPTGQCTGSAEAVWRAMPDQQREQYLGALVETARDSEAGAGGLRVRVIGGGGAGPMLGCGQLAADSPNISFSPTAC